MTEKRVVRNLLSKKRRRREKDNPSLSSCVVLSVITIFAPIWSSFGQFLRIDEESNDNAIPGTSGANADNLLEIDSALLPITLRVGSRYIK